MSDGWERAGEIIHWLSIRFWRNARGAGDSRLTDAVNVQIIEAHSTDCVGIIRALFVEYANAMAVDLCFQGFDQELVELPGKYAPPTGRLLLALADGKAAGCVALRNMGDGTCEMKRLYVRSAFRRNGIGRTLTTRLIGAAREIGYARMRLDTLGSMEAAIALYESLGFRRIEPYYNNPHGCAVFLELNLR